MALRGLSLRKGNPVEAKKLYIGAVVYIVIAGGTCGALMYSMRDFNAH
jgi:hypothetical protein